MSDELELTYPSGLITKTKIDDGEFTILTDYQEERGGYNISYSPWKVFLTAILTCQGVNLAKYCREYDIDYSQVSLKLVPKVEDILRDEFPEYHLQVSVPESFPQDHIEPMVEKFMDCPVTNHLTELKPVLKTFVNDELIGEKRR
ncbi:MAG: hypothetical protein Q4F26_05320 [Atopococcus tabaci]|uniref:OsmC-like protein n=1 Tax=Atopococcus tabaci TaxID=269774 RepID=A0AA43UD20_9LACT|nr:hypothetical protein [Atopococcus tabaci]